MPVFCMTTGSFLRVFWADVEVNTLFLLDPRPSLKQNPENTGWNEGWGGLHNAEKAGRPSLGCHSSCLPLLSVVMWNQVTDQTAAGFGWTCVFPRKLWLRAGIPAAAGIVRGQEAGTTLPPWECPCWEARWPQLCDLQGQTPAPREQGRSCVWVSVQVSSHGQLCGRPRNRVYFTVLSACVTDKSHVSAPNAQNTVHGSWMKFSFFFLIKLAYLNNIIQLYYTAEHAYLHFQCL